MKKGRKGMAKRENSIKRTMNGLLGYTREEEPEDLHEDMENNAADKPEEPEYTEAPASRMMPAEKKEEAVIPPGMKITGNITAKCDMKVLGHIVGDVVCEGNIDLSGNIEGNVSAGNLLIRRGMLTGDVEVRENAVLEREAGVKGNLSAQNVRSAAQSEGEIQAAGIVELQTEAVVQGDITAGGISVMEGARIQGMVVIGE